MGIQRLFPYFRPSKMKLMTQIKESHDILVFFRAKENPNYWTLYQSYPRQGSTARSCVTKVRFRSMDPSSKSNYWSRYQLWSNTMFYLSSKLMAKMWSKIQARVLRTETQSQIGCPLIEFWLVHQSESENPKKGFNFTKGHRCRCKSSKVWIWITGIEW